MSEAVGFGPQRRPRALVLSFDNLGEASELERGTWPPENQLGRHPSVTRVLPRLLDELDAHGLNATFFVEAINCGLYPDALRAIAGRGHELGVHGWRHEPWSQLAAPDERALLERAHGAFADLELDPRGFRPPGGELTQQSDALLRELGFSWISPAGGRQGELQEGLVRVPFDWELVDAYHLMERFGELRRQRGDGPAPMPAAELEQRMAGRLSGGEAFQTLILHPFLMLDEVWFAGVRRLLAVIAGLARDGSVWVVSGGDFADWRRASAPE